MSCLLQRTYLRFKTLENKGINDHVKKLPIVPVHAPDFKRGIDHFCIDAGGRDLVDGKIACIYLIQKSNANRPKTLHFGTFH